MQFIRIALIAVLLNGCGDIITTSDGGGSSAQAADVRTVPIDSQQAARLRNVMVPLLRAANNPRSAERRAHRSD